MKNNILFVILLKLCNFALYIVQYNVFVLNIVHLLIASTLQYHTSLKMGRVVLAALHWMKRKKTEKEQDRILEGHQIWISSISVSAAKYVISRSNSNDQDFRNWTATQCKTSGVEVI